MNYITNEIGEVKVRTMHGVIKFLPKHIVEDGTTMRNAGLEIVPQPVPFKYENDQIKEGEPEKLADEQTESDPIRKAGRPKKN